MTSPARHIFISYGRQDAEAIAFQLERDLIARGHQVWLDRAEIQAGKSWEEQIEQGILRCDVFIALLSPHAVRRPAGVCLDEISLARYSNRRIIPAMVAICRPPLGIYRLDWIDFQDWDKPARYQAALSRLLAAMNQPAGVEGTHARIFASLKPLDFGSEVARLIQDFTGREWLDAELERWLERDDSRVFFITGDPGTGKSAFMAHLVHKHPRVIAYHFCVASLVDSIEPFRFVRSIGAQLATQMEDYRAALETADIEHLGETDPAALMRRLIADPLKRVKAEKPQLVLVDALDETLGQKGHPIGKILCERLDDLPSWIRLVISSRKEPEILDMFSRFRPHEIDASRPENLEDVAGYIAKKLQSKRLVELLAEKGVAPSAVVELISRKGAGNFLYVTHALAAIETGQIDLQRPETFPEGLIGIYQSFFERVFPQPKEYAEFRPLLDVMTASREPLTAEHLARFLARERFDLENDLQRVAVFFPDRGGFYQAYHKSLTDWLCGQAGRDRKYRVNAEAGHRKLAAALWGEFQAGRCDRFTLAHLPAHLTAAEEWDQLGHLLTEPSFLESKTTAGLVLDLAEDFGRAIESMPATKSAHSLLCLLKDALYPDLSFIANHPFALFQCIWNNGWWHDCPQAGRYYDLPEDASPNPAGLPSTGRLSSWLESWAARRVGSAGYWLRSLRPPVGRLGNAQIAVLDAGESSVHSLAISSTGTLLAAGHRNGAIRVWESRSRKQTAYLKGPEGTADAVCFSADEKQVFSGGHDGTIRVWDVALAKVLASYPFKNDLADTPDGEDLLKGRRTWSTSVVETGGGIDSLAISSDGKLLVSFNKLGVMRFRDLVKPGHGGIHLTTPGTGYSVDLALPRFALSSKTGVPIGTPTIFVWDLSGQPVAGLEGHRELARGIALSQDGKRLLSGGADHLVRLWNVDTGKEIWCQAGHKGTIGCLAFSPGGQTGASGSKDGTVRVWDLGRGSEEACFRGHNGSVEVLLFSPDGRTLISASDDQTIRTWDVYRAASSKQPQHHPERITKIQTSPDGSLIATGSEDGMIRLWRTSDGISPQQLCGHQLGIHCIRFSEDGTHLVSGSADGTVRVWRLMDGAEVGRAGEPYVPSLSRDSIWKTLGKLAPGYTPDYHRYIYEAVFSPNGDHVAYKNGKGDWFLWNWRQELPVALSDAGVPSWALAKREKGLNEQWRAVPDQSGTAICPTTTDEAVAWSTIRLEAVANARGTCLWSGYDGNHLYLFSLERT
jgi:WD40 repeat protein